MSELKAVTVYDAYWKANSVGEGTGIQVYLKSEADKVIANRDYEIEELKKSIGRLLKAKTEQVMDEVLRRCLIYGEGFVPVEHAMRLVADMHRQKHKRCLMMAEWCEATALWCYQAANTLPKGFHATLYGKPVMIEPDRLFKRYARLTKWHERWLELAEKFKEAK